MRWLFLLLLLVSPALPVLAQSTPKIGAFAPETNAHIVAVYEQFNKALSEKRYAEAAPLGEELCRLDSDPGDHYNLACVYVFQHRPGDALQKLREAIRYSANDPTLRIGDLMETDTDLDPLRTRAAFAPLIKQAKKAQWEPAHLAYDTSADVHPVAFARSGPDNGYLAQLRAQYPLETLVAGARGDLERVKMLCTWVHTRWNHVGDAKHQPTDPLGLLKAAETGDNFRCVEYGITVAGCLNAVGIPARVVRAQAQDMETRRFGAGHVFAEAYLRDRKKWVFVDPQTNVVGEQNGEPLNTVEFRQAFATRPSVNYPPILGSCFYYFTYSLDETYPVGERKAGSIVLVPKGAFAPRYFQRNAVKPFARETHNPADVYAAPEMP